MNQYFVHCWPLPKRGPGTYPKGYLSTLIEAPTPREAAEKVKRQHPDKQRFEVGSVFGRLYKFTIK